MLLFEISLPGASCNITQLLKANYLRLLNKHDLATEIPIEVILQPDIH